MIQHSTSYDEAVVASSRRMYVRATFDLIDPDAVVDSVTSNSESEISLSHQIGDRGLDADSQNIATLELDRWALDGSFYIRPDDPADREGQVGWESAALTGADGVFSQPYPYVEMAVSDLSILQAVTLVFPDASIDGYPVDFKVEMWSGATLLHAATVTSNADNSVVLDGFTVNNPTRLRLTAEKWSLPYYRARLARFMLGLYEEWDTSVIRDVDVYTEVTFSGLKIPYSSCTLRVENKNHRFDPYAPNTIFTSVEERQAIVVDLGLRLADGSIEWLPGGTYYQQSAGWSLQDLTVTWELLDIVGMLVKRKFVVPATLPTTLEGWMGAVMSSLGVNFSDKYIVDDDVKTLALTSTSDDVADKTCGEILRFACMATNTWPRQDFPTGHLRVGKLSRSEGNRITLDNMSSYPEMSANDDIADITFELDSGSVLFPGNNTDSEVSLSVNNPFVHTTADARKAVLSCLFEYGGRSFEVVSRGNPSSECGDIQAVDTQFLSTISARLYKQQLKLDQGVMRKVPSYLVQSPNDSLYENKVVLTGTGEWTSPVVGTIKVTLIGGGTGGMGGGGGNMHTDTSSPEDNEGGIGGNGGKVYIVELTVVADQVLAYSCGVGGVAGKGGEARHDGNPGGVGGDTSFGVYSSASGTRYDIGLMDIQSGAVYAQRGGDYGYEVEGLNGSGGAGGKMGKNGKRVTVTKTNTETGESYTVTKTKATPKPGEDGKPGKDGCVIIEW